MALFQLVCYSMNPEIGYFEKTQSQPESLPVSGLPYKFQRQRTWSTEINSNAPECLQISEQKIFTGLQRIGRDSWFTGDLLTWRKSKSTKHLLIIFLSKTNDVALIAIFRNLYKHSYNLRSAFANEMIPLIWNRYRLYLHNKNAPGSSH